MNDFERIYTVIKSQYSCGVPYYNYDSCTYDQLSNMYYQQGTLNLPSSTGYSNVPFDDIPVACGFPNIVYRQCVPSEPPNDGVKTSGFRINVNGSYVLPDTNNLILKNPLGFNMNIDTGEEAKTNLLNSLYLFEKRGFNNCIKHINTNKYVGFNNNNDFTLVDKCNDTNSFIYDDERKKLIYNIDKCVNPDKYYQIVPNNTKMVLSSCEQSVNVILENEGNPVDYYSKIKLIAEKEKILNPNITIPTSLYNTIMYYQSNQNYNYGLKNTYGQYDKLNFVINMKCKYSNISILTLIQTDTKSCAYLSLDNGVSWKQLTTSTTIQDIDISYDGKYITLTDSTNFYVLNNADTSGIIITKKNYLFVTKETSYSQITQSYCNVFVSKDGKYQYIYDYKNIMYSEDFGNNFKILTKVATLQTCPLCVSSNGLYAFYITNNMINYVSEISILNKEYKLTLNNCQKALMSYDGKYCFIIDNSNLYCNDNYLNENNWRITSLDNIKNSFENILGRKISNQELGFSIDMCISKNGKFVYITCTFLHQNLNEWVGLIFYSNDYGKSINQLRTDDDYLNNNLTRLTSVDVSEDGLNIIFSYNDKIYNTKLKEEPDNTIEKNIFISPIISIPKYDYKFIDVFSSYTQVVKNGKNLFSIVNNTIRVFGSTFNFSSFPISYTPITMLNISNICKSFGFNENTFVLFTIDNKLYYTSYNYLVNRTSAIQIYETQKNITHMTFETREKSIYIILTDLIHYSSDSISWQTVNMIPKKWKMAYIVPTLKNNEFTIYCIEEYGKFYFSYDSGVTWKSNDILENYYWTSIDTTDDGKIVIATIKDNYPLISYDGGLSFKFLKIDVYLTDNSGKFIKQFVDCAISPDGKVISLIIDNGRIMNSYDKGLTWNYYGQYDFYQYGMNRQDSNKLYSISSSFKYTLTPGYSLSSYPVVDNYFYFKVNTTTNPTYRLEGNEMIYIGLDPGTYDASENLVIKADYIQIKYIYNLKVKFFLTGPENFYNVFKGIKDIIIMGSNDDINFYKLKLNNPLPRTPSNSKIFKISIDNEKYYKTYRIIFIIEPLYNEKNQLIEHRSIYYFNLEGDISYNTTAFNTDSRWKYSVYNYDNTLLYNRDNQILRGNYFDLIFMEYNLDRNISDVTYTVSDISGHSLSSDLYVNNLTINSGYTLRTNGYRIFCTGKLTNYGTITNSGDFESSGNSLGRGGNGGAGGILSVSATSGSNTINTVVEANGGAGGKRSNNTLSGGAGGIATLDIDTEILYNRQNAIVGKDSSNNLIQGGAGGGGGAGGSITYTGITRINNNGGAGGRGGGIIMICANEIENNGTITVRGQNGFNATPLSFTPSSNTQYGACGGGGGGGGTIILVTRYTSNLSNSGFVVSGGTGGLTQTNTSTTITTDSSGRSLQGTPSENGKDGRLVVVFV